MSSKAVADKTTAAKTAADLESSDTELDQIVGYEASDWPSAINEWGTTISSERRLKFLETQGLLPPKTVSNWYVNPDHIPVWGTNELVLF